MSLLKLRLSVSLKHRYPPTFLLIRTNLKRALLMQLWLPQVIFQLIVYVGMFMFMFAVFSVSFLPLHNSLSRAYVHQDRRLTAHYNEFMVNPLMATCQGKSYITWSWYVINVSLGVGAIDMSPADAVWLAKHGDLKCRLGHEISSIACMCYM